MNGCSCPPDQSRLCDDCTGLVEHLDHRTVRRCAVEDCRKPLARKPGERGRRWATRDYCNRSCYMRLRVAGAKPHTAAVDIPESKVCAMCGAGFVRRVGERLNRWLERECCGKSCAASRARGSIRKAAPKPKPKPVPKPAPPAAPVVEPAPVEVAARPVWRPAGFTKVVNPWVGHRPAPADAEVVS